MNTKRFSMLLAVLLLLSLCGCAQTSTATQPGASQIPADHQSLVQQDSRETTPQTAPNPTTTAPQTAITREQAQEIALAHAGFTADQVQYLRTEYEIDDGIPEYEVSFHEGRWEYEYEIHAETGDILSFSRDD